MLATTDGADQFGPRAWVRRAVVWGGWSLLFVPLTIVLHELGHWSAAMWLGFPDPALHYSSISHGEVTNFPLSAVGIVGLAGPVVTVLLTLFAGGWFCVQGPARWAFALCLSAASRFVVGVPYTVVNTAVLLTGGRLQAPAFDEHKAGTALGWSGDALLASTAVLLIAALLSMAFKLPRAERSAAWPGLLLSTALGWILWMKALGPLLLP